MVRSFPISAYLAGSIPESIGATNIGQADDNEPFSEYNGDDWNQGNFPVVNKDNI